MNIMFLHQVKLEQQQQQHWLTCKLFSGGTETETDIKQPSRELMKLVTASQLYSFVPQW